MTYPKLPVELQTEICTYGLFTSKQQIWISRIEHYDVYIDMVKNRQIKYSNINNSLVIESAPLSSPTITRQVTIPNDHSYYKTETLINNVYKCTIKFRPH